MADIGEIKREIVVEPMTAPVDVPSTPTPEPAEPVREKEPVPA